MSQMVIQAISRHAKIKAIEAVQGILIFFELIRRNNNVVTSQQIQTGAPVVSDQAIDDSWIFIAMIEKDSITAVVTDTDSVDHQFVDTSRDDSVTALFVTVNPKVRQAYTPQLVLAATRSFGMLEHKGRFTVDIHVLDVRCRTGALDTDVLNTNM